MHIDCMLWDRFHDINDINDDDIVELYVWAVIRTSDLVTPHVGAPESVGMGCKLVFNDDTVQLQSCNTAGAPATVMDIQFVNPSFKFNEYDTTYILPSDGGLLSDFVARVFKKCVLKYA